MIRVRALVILPTYNEAENVLPLTREILAADDRLEILVVDDNSPDGTGDLVEGAGRKDSRIQLLRRPAKLGLGTAYLEGFRFGLDRGYDLVLTMDCDGSHHPRHLPAILAAIEDADLVIGSRYVRGGGIVNWAWYRRALSRFANFYARSLLRLPVRDCTGGYPCYRCLFPTPPADGAIASCAEGGVLGALAGVMGSLQAIEVIKELLGIGESLAGRLIIYDALEATTRKIRLRPDPNCALCGDSGTIKDLSIHMV